MTFPSTMTGETAMHTNASYQQAINPISIPVTNAHPPSIVCPILSAPTPLRTPLSSAIALVKTLVPFSFSSNQPMCFFRMLSYRTYRIASETLLDIVPIAIILKYDMSPAIKAIEPMMPE